MEWLYDLNTEDEFMMECNRNNNHAWIDEEFEYYPVFYDQEILGEVVMVAFSHCKVCGAQRKKYERSE
jgi:hypothetical protein